jgi:hypothetical protein
MNQDIAVLAKKAVEYSALTRTQLESRKWEAMLLVGNIYGSASEAGVLLAKKDIEARFPKELAAAGQFALLDPYWHLRVDDGKPPAVQRALVSALENPSRTLATRLQSLRQVPEKERPPLTDLVRALSADAFSGATGIAQEQYLSALQRLDKNWTKNPWLMVQDQSATEGPALQILIDSQGQADSLNNGGIFDKNKEDDLFWTAAVRDWDVDFLRDNPLAQAYVATDKATQAVIDTGAAVVGGAADAARGFAKVVAWAPYVLGAFAVAGVAAVVVVKVVQVARA